VARKQLVKDLEEAELMEKIEDYTHNVGFSQRGGEPVEPYLSHQWFVKMKPLADIALDVVRNGEIQFYPNHWVKTYEHWMTNIRDWCISRQLWWGHRIPVYYTIDGQFTAAKDENEARLKLNLSADEQLSQDEDVLDTWFSSWLWPMTTMRWNMDEGYSTAMHKFLPTDLLVTAPDIIFFWVARMIMASVKFTGKIPFKNVYFTSTIRDGKGRKLSKSLGNSPDPLNIVSKYGADAVRFTVLYLAPLGQDIKMDVDVKAQDIPSMEIGRNFANKIWNVARFLQMKAESIVDDDLQNDDTIDYVLSITDKWIDSRLNSTIKKSIETLNIYRLNEYSKILYDFIWKDFCDWYVEMFKVQFNNSKTSHDKRQLVRFVLDKFENILKLIHPVMPFISEEIWHLLYQKHDNESISTQPFTTFNETSISQEVENVFELIQYTIDEIRSLRSSMNIAPNVFLPISIKLPDEKLSEYFTSVSNSIKELSKASEICINPKVNPSRSIISVVRNIEIFITLDENFDFSNELQRLEKELSRLSNNITSTDKKLSNDKFISNAAPELVAYEKEKLDNMKNSYDKTLININNIKSLLQ
jgi:valyl-tRNA synthetase